MANIVSQIADKVRPVGVSTNYGEPIEIGDQTIVRVSLGWFGFGAGGDDENGGGGGGRRLDPGWAPTSVVPARTCSSSRTSSRSSR